jgi:hypothetical protein
MLFARVNRSNPEKIFIVAYNSYSSASLTNGQAAMWDYAADANGVGVTKPTAANKAGGNHYGAALAGIAAETIAAGSYGLIQVYGYHSAVRVRSVTGGKPAGAAGVALALQTANFCLETVLGEIPATTTVTQTCWDFAGFMLAAQASYTTKAVACFIKAL